MLGQAGDGRRVEAGAAAVQPVAGAAVAHAGRLQVAGPAPAQLVIVYHQE